MSRAERHSTAGESADECARILRRLRPVYAPTTRINSVSSLGTGARNSRADVPQPQGSAKVKTYLVRTIETAHVVGIFCAQDSVELFRLVDGQVDPEDCEYIELKTGDGMFFDAQFIEMPVGEDEEATDYDVEVDSVNPIDETCGPQMTDSLFDRMNGEDGAAGWQLFTEDDVQKACEPE